MQRTRQRSQKGISILELLVTLGVLSIVLGIAAINLRPLSNDASNAANELSGFLRQARARAMTTTSAVRIIYDAQTRLRTARANTCNTAAGNWADETLVHTLNEGARITDSWTSGHVIVCFNSRGISSENVTVNLRDRENRLARVEILLGGGVEIR
jgi:Tfp pilus assembly protein FimT